MRRSPCHLRSRWFSSGRRHRSRHRPRSPVRSPLPARIADSGQGRLSKTTAKGAGIEQVLAPKLLRAFEPAIDQPWVGGVVWTVRVEDQNQVGRPRVIFEIGGGLGPNGRIFRRLAWTARAGGLVQTIESTAIS